MKNTNALLIVAGGAALMAIAVAATWKIADRGNPNSPGGRNTKVLVLRVKDANLPGLTVADPGEEPKIRYEKGRLYLTRQPVSVMVKTLQDAVRMRVIDETGLTNLYDFSLAWKADTKERIDGGKIPFDKANTLLNGWDLELDPVRGEGGGRPVTEEDVKPDRKLNRSKQREQRRKDEAIFTEANEGNEENQI